MTQAAAPRNVAPVYRQSAAGKGGDFFEAKFSCNDVLLQCRRQIPCIIYGRIMARYTRVHLRCKHRYHRKYAVTKN
jgi:hypothetical protein